MDSDTREAIMTFITERFEGDSSGHDLDHTLRVTRLALSISDTEGGNRDVIETAALLHDVDDCKLFGKEPGNTDSARALLVNLGVDQRFANEVCSIIASISFKCKDSVRPSSSEGKIVQDADRLDAIGAIGIARAFSYGGNRGRRMHDPDIPPSLDMNSAKYFANKGTTINHFYEKLLLLKNLMNTETGRAIAENRHRYMQGFLDEFYAEWDGKA